MAARFVDELAERFLGMTIVVDQPVIGLGLLDRVQVLTLDILDQRDLQRLGIVELTDDDRHFVEPRSLCRTPAPLASDDLIPLAMWPDDDWLDQPARGDRLGEFLERRL